MALAKGSEEYPCQLEAVGGPSNLKIIESNSTSDLAWKSGSLRMSSAMMQPTDHMSTPVEYVVAPRRISGALDGAAYDLLEM